MKFEDVIKILMPKDKFFFGHLEKSSQNLVETAREFKKFGNSSKEAGFSDLARKIKDLEHEGDRITYKIFEELNKTFLTPLDREDIRELASRIDDVLDIIDSIAARIVLYKVSVITPEMQNLFDVILESVEEISGAVKKLRRMRHCEDIHDIFLKIHKLEEEGDQIYRKTIAMLFEKEKDPITLVKLKEIYEAMERAIDMCKITGDIIETIFMKNS